MVHERPIILKIVHMANIYNMADKPGSAHGAVYSWSEFANDINNFGGSIDDFLAQASQDPGLSPEKSQFLAQLGLQRMQTADDRAYNDPSAQVARLVAAGMSRTQALQMVSGGSAATPPEVPTPQMTPEAQSALQGVQVGTQVVGAAVDLASAIPQIKAQNIINKSLPDLQRAQLAVLDGQGTALKYSNEMAAQNVQALSASGKFFTALSNFINVHGSEMLPDDLQGVMEFSRGAGIDEFGASGQMLADAAAEYGDFLLSNPVAYAMASQELSSKYLESSFNHAFLCNNKAQALVSDIEPLILFQEYLQARQVVQNLIKDGKLTDEQIQTEMKRQGLISAQTINANASSELMQTESDLNDQNFWFRYQVNPSEVARALYTTQYYTTLGVNGARMAAKSDLFDMGLRQTTAVLNMYENLAGLEYYQRGENHPFNSLQKFGLGIECSGLMNHWKNYTGLSEKWTSPTTQMAEPIRLGVNAIGGASKFLPK